MTRYYSNFEDADIGEVPTGWATSAFDWSSHALSSGITAEYADLPVKERGLLYRQATPTNYAAIGWAALGQLHDVEVLTLVKRRETGSPTTGAARAYVFTHMSGGAGAQVAYIGRFHFSDDNIPGIYIETIYEGVASTGLASSAPARIYPTDPEAAYWMRFQVINLAGSPSTKQARLRVWKDGEEEPADWDITGTSSFLWGIGGYVGLQAYNKDLYFNFCSVSNNPTVQDAWKPRTNAEFIEALDDQNLSARVIVDMAVTGYASDGGVGSPSTYTADRAVYLGNGGFTTQAWDDPPSQHYDAWITRLPTFSQQMDIALDGRNQPEATVGIGALEVDNSSGVRDDWLRMKWKRDQFEMFYGFDGWPKHDFRRQIVGRVDQPIAPSRNRLQFAIADILDALNFPLQVNRFSSSDTQANGLKPVLAGVVRLIEPPLKTGLGFQVNDGEAVLRMLYSDLSALSGPANGGTVTAVDTVNNILSFSGAHGLSDDTMIYFIDLAGIAPLVEEEWYWVKYSGLGLATNQIKLSATRGGAVLDITSGGSAIGVAYTWYGTDTPETVSENGLRRTTTAGLVTLVANPASTRIFARDVSSKPEPADTPFDTVGGATQPPADVVDELIFDRYGLSRNYRDPDTFEAFRAAVFDNAGIYFYDEQVTAREALRRVMGGVNGWFSPTPSGRLQVGRLGLPSSSAVEGGAFTMSDVRDVTLTKVILPVDPSTVSVRYGMAYLRNGPVLSAVATLSDLIKPYLTEVDTSAAAYGVPLDSYARASECFAAVPFESIFWGETGAEQEVARILAFNARKLGIFTFRTRRRAARLAIGNTIELTHDQLGWKTYSGSDPQSPDNAATFDATKAVVLGIDVNFSSPDPFPVTLTVYRQMPGYYPTANLN